MKNVLITGASRGIGKACAEIFEEKGYRVFKNYNNTKIPGEFSIKADITDKNQVDEMISYIEKNFGGVDILVNNAGIAPKQKLITDTTDAEFDEVFDINVKGMFLVTKRALPYMINKKSGSIINISSVWGISGGSCEVLYSASKASIIGFTKALAKELGPSGIRVNAIAPGFIDTDMNKHLTEEDVSYIIEETPLMRVGYSDDVAKTALFLAENSSSFITGEVINVSGGIVI